MELSGITYNITAAWAVDREFVYIIGPLAAFGLRVTPFGFFGASLGCLWGAFGRLWADFGLPLAPFGSLWGALGLPLAVLWSPFGRLGAPVGSLWGVFWNLLKTGRHFPRKMGDITAPAHKNKPPVILPPHPRKWCQEPLLGPHLHMRWGPG